MYTLIAHPLVPLCTSKCHSESLQNPFYPNNKTLGGFLVEFGYWQPWTTLTQAAKSGCQLKPDLHYSPPSS